MDSLNMKPEEIEAESFRIITRSIVAITMVNALAILAAQG